MLSFVVEARITLNTFGTVWPGICRGPESTREYASGACLSLLVPGCQSTKMLSILGDGKPTRILVVTSSRCTNLWCRETITGHQAMSVREYAIGVCLVMSRGGKSLSPRPRKSHALAGVGGWGNEITTRTKPLGNLGLEPKCNVGYCAFRYGFQNMFTHF